MTMTERLDDLRDKFSKGTISAGELAGELRGLLDVSSEFGFGEKVGNAIVWAEKYTDPGRSAEHGGQARVREIILRELASARSIAERRQEQKR